MSGRREKRESRPDVLVLGGGIVGLAVARELAGRGVRVEVVERGRPGQQATWAAAGMLAPLAEVPETGPFFAACRDGRDLWTSWGPALESETGVDLGYDRSGALALDDGGLDALRRAAAALGEPCEDVDRATLRALVPDVAPSIERALLLSGEHKVDNRKVADALTASLERRGVAIHVDTAVAVEATTAGVTLRGEGWHRDAGALVLAAGAWSGGIAGLPPLPVRPVRGQMLRLTGVAWPCRGSVRSGHGYAVRRGDGGLLVGATVEEAGFDAHPTPAGVGWLLDLVRTVFPGLAERPIVETWAGLRPGTPDGLPLLGRLDERPVWAATGHYRNGILLAPWTARELAAAILAGSDPPALAPFSPDRFAAAATSPATSPARG